MKKVSIIPKLNLVFLDCLPDRTTFGYMHQRTGSTRFFGFLKRRHAMMLDDASVIWREWSDERLIGSIVGLSEDDCTWNTVLAIEWKVSFPSMVFVLMSTLSVPSWISLVSPLVEMIPWGRYDPCSIFLIWWSATQVLSFADLKAESSSSQHMKVFKEEWNLASELRNNSSRHQ